MTTQELIRIAKNNVTKIDLKVFLDNRYSLIHNIWGWSLEEKDKNEFLEDFITLIFGDTGLDKKE